MLTFGKNWIYNKKGPGRLQGREHCSIPKPQHYNEYFRIEKLDAQAEHGALYWLRHQQYKKTPVVRRQDIDSIVITLELLNRLGFHLQNEQTGIYSLMNLTSGFNAGYKRTSEGGEVKVLPIARIYQYGALIPQHQMQVTWEMVDKYTIDVPLVHMLQNYFTEQELPIDFSVL